MNLETMFHDGSSSPQKSTPPSLPPEQMEQARQRLAVIAGISILGFGLVSVMTGAAVAFNWADARIVGTPSQRFITFRLVVTILSLVLAVAMLWVARSKSQPIHRVLVAGLWFEVILCFQLAFFAIWYWRETYQVTMWMNWSTPVIIIFGAMVPASPRQTLRAGMVAAVMNPIAGWVLAFADIVDFGPIDAARVTGSPVVAAFLAARISSLIHNLGVDLAQAKRMGAYQLETLLGRGGMGEVWSATHSLLARPAAIKLIRHQSDGTQAAGMARKRFEREARATSRLSSPHSIMLYDFGTTHDGAFYYVMELLDGLDLNTLVERYGPQPPERVVHILQQACDSLMDAHHIGLVHRDIKPANLFICEKGLRRDWVKVLDFGLVSLRDRSNEDVTLTGQGFAGGTPAFMAPEQAAGVNVDGRADLYALGCVAYWLLSGQLVFEADSALAIIVAHARDEPPLLSAVTELDIPADLEALIMKCLQKDPNDRPQTARELRHDLEQLQCAGRWDGLRADRWWDIHQPTERHRQASGQTTASLDVPPTEA